jgi:hypothetical protein
VGLEVKNGMANNFLYFNDGTASPLRRFEVDHEGHHFEALVRGSERFFYGPVPGVPAVDNTRDCGEGKGNEKSYKGEQRRL